MWRKAWAESLPEDRQTVKAHYEMWVRNEAKTMLLDATKAAEIKEAGGLERANSIFEAFHSVPPIVATPGTHGELLHWIQTNPCLKGDFSKEFAQRGIVYFSTYKASAFASEGYPKGICKLQLVLPNDGFIYLPAAGHADIGTAAPIDYHHRSHLFVAASDPDHPLSRMPAIRAFAERFFGDLPTDLLVAYSQLDQRLDIQFEAQPKGQRAIRLWISFEPGLQARSASSDKHYKRIFGNGASFAKKAKK